jgi:SAM-dependent methyltransferase
MSTDLSGCADSPERVPNQDRQSAESFGADVARYDRTRPSYPTALVERIVAASPGPRILDVGCGTGISSRQLRAAGCAVLGVEPDARMAGWARDTGIETEVAKFEEWDSAGREFDTVVAGQTWHWVDPDAGAARAARVLRPDGLLALFWNVFQAGPEVTQGFADAYQRALPESALSQAMAMPTLDVYSTIFTKTADGIRASGAFSDPEQWRFEWEWVYTRDEWLDQVPTFGGHSNFPAETLQRLLDSIGAVIDAAGGSFTMSYTTVAVTAVRANSFAPS